MNNKASKRLLAASVASLMLVVAFCGFIYVGDDADAEDGESSTTAYVKKVIVAENDGDGTNTDGDLIDFEIVTTQNVNQSGSGIKHVGVWSTKYVTLGNALQNPAGSGSSILTMSVTTDGNVHTFSVNGITVGKESVQLTYTLTSTVGEGSGAVSVTQSIYYRFDVEVVEALPNNYGTNNNFAGFDGYIGVGLVKSVADWSNSHIDSGSGLKFYASGLPGGLSMNIEGTLSGVPKVSGEHDVTITVHNGTGFVNEFHFKIDVKNKIASLDANVYVESDSTKSGYGDVIKVSDDRYLVKQGTKITVNAVVTGNQDGTILINGYEPSSVLPMELVGTGEMQIEVSFTFKIDGSTDVKLVDYITVVVVDVVEDATTGMGLVAGEVPSVSTTL